MPKGLLDGSLIVSVSVSVIGIEVEVEKGIEITIGIETEIEKEIMNAGAEIANIVEIATEITTPMLTDRCRLLPMCLSSSI